MTMAIQGMLNPGKRRTNPETTGNGKAAKNIKSEIRTGKVRSYHNKPHEDNAIGDHWVEGYGIQGWGFIQPDKPDGVEATYGLFVGHNHIKHSDDDRRYGLQKGETVEFRTQRNQRTKAYCVTGPGGKHVRGRTLYHKNEVSWLRIVLLHRLGRLAKIYWDQCRKQDIRDWRYKMFKWISNNREAFFTDVFGGIDPSFGGRDPQWEQQYRAPAIYLWNRYLKEASECLDNSQEAPPWSPPRTTNDMSHRSTSSRANLPITRLGEPETELGTPEPPNQKTATSQIRVPDTAGNYRHSQRADKRKRQADIEDPIEERQRTTRRTQECFLCRARRQQAAIDSAERESKLSTPQRPASSSTSSHIPAIRWRYDGQSKVEAQVADAQEFAQPDLGKDVMSQKECETVEREDGELVEHEDGNPMNLSSEFDRDEGSSEHKDKGGNMNSSASDRGEADSRSPETEGKTTDYADLGECGWESSMGLEAWRAQVKLEEAEAPIVKIELDDETGSESEDASGHGQQDTTRHSKSGDVPTQQAAMYEQAVAADSPGTDMNILSAEFEIHDFSDSDEPTITTTRQ